MTTEQMDWIDDQRSDYILTGHKCKAVAKLYMGENRDWWVGELLEPIPGYPQETHCFHIATPLKSVVLGMNRADWNQLAVLSYIVAGDKHVNAEWIERTAAGMRNRAEAVRG